MSNGNHENYNGESGKIGAANEDVARQKEAFVKLLTKFIRYDDCAPAVTFNSIC